MRSICCAAAAAILCSTASGQQVPKEAVGSGEFPALQFLPPGSVLKGISLPTYEKHRVASLLTAEQMEIKTSTLVVLRKLRAYVYGDDSGIIEVQSDEVFGDFSLSRLTSPGKVTVTSPKFEARGEGFIFSQTRSVGVVRGPVHTRIRTAEDKDAPTTQKSE